MKPSTRNALIAGIIGTGLTIGFIRYRQHVDFWDMVRACDSAREKRLGVARLIDKAFINNEREGVNEAWLTLLDLNTVIERCVEKGF